MTTTTKRDFLLNQMPSLLGKLTPETEGNFGLMTPQVMVEHIVSVLKNTTIKHEGERESPANPKQEGFQKFIKSGCVLKYRASDKTKADLPKLKYDSLEAAVAEVPAAIKGFYDFWAANQDYTPYASFMGELPFEDIEHFHYMHFRYHLWQFGLIAEYPG